MEDEDMRRYLDARDKDMRRYLDARDKDMSGYLDALLERHVTVTEALIAAIQSGFGDVQSGFAALQAEIADQREQIQANTQALLTVLDRLGPA